MFIAHDGSMVLLYIYMVTWIPSIYPSHVSIYTSTMDPMGWASRFVVFLLLRSLGAPPKFMRRFLQIPMFFRKESETSNETIQRNTMFYGNDDRSPSV